MSDTPMGDGPVPDHDQQPAGTDDQGVSPAAPGTTPTEVFPAPPPPTTPESTPTEVFPPSPAAVAFPATGGAPVPPPPPGGMPVPAPGTTHDAAAAAGLRFCPNCGASAPMDAAFCPRCGHGYQPPAAGFAPPPPLRAGYPQPGYGAPMAPVYMPRTNGLAIASLVLSIVWVYWLGSVLAVIFGHIALSQINKSQGTQTGRGLAIAGLVVGYVGLAVLVLFFVLAIVAASAPGPATYRY